eukprot:323352-Pyramimonas_sp.AAC.1
MDEAVKGMITQIINMAARHEALTTATRPPVSMQPVVTGLTLAPSALLQPAQAPPPAAAPAAAPRAGGPAEERARDRVGSRSPERGRAA